MASNIVFNPVTNQIVVQNQKPISLVITTNAGTTSSPTSIAGVPINVTLPIAGGDVLYIASDGSGQRWINYPSDDFANGGYY